MKGKPPDLVGLLAILAKAGRAKTEVSVRELRDVIGRRSFAPLLLAASIVGFTPLGGVPGVPTTLATIVVIIAVQIVDRKVEGKKLVRGAMIGRQPRLAFEVPSPLSIKV